jgi:tartrate dehydrogenase/decarboxylase/D-malate dehydrogenase
MKQFKIATIPGDGIGKEVVPEGIRVLDAAARLWDLAFSWHTFDWSCETYVKTGRMMPENAIEQLRSFDAIFLGAVGHPEVPDHVSLWGLLIPIRRSFRQYVNLRPVRLLPGIVAPLRTSSRVKLIFVLSARTTKANIPTSVGGSTREQRMSWWCNRRYSRAGV